MTLGRSETAISTRGEAFWAEPLASPSADGSRISFNSNCSSLGNLTCTPSGTIDQFILFVY